MSLPAEIKSWFGSALDLFATASCFCQSLIQGFEVGKFFLLFLSFFVVLVSPEFSNEHAQFYDSNREITCKHSCCLCMHHLHIWSQRLVFKWNM